ncbi:MAG: UvrD-helicase domain-containing protein [Opitutaceae bacterium]|nr:UvrD-helicase domain-containing protein [Opitutaceae bacterium]
MSQIPPVDAARRERFAQETDRNFSLSCPAGAGKTHSVVERVVAIARRPDAAQRLRTLVVVTFTKKAAEEMQARARAAIARGGFPGPVRAAFDQAFFGTIHAFAVLLLQSYGHHLGVPSAFEVSEDLAGLWAGFLRDWTGQEEIWQRAEVRRLLRFCPMQDILTLARKWDFARTLPAAPGPAAIDFRSVYDFPPPKRADTAANIEAFQQALRHWESLWHDDAGGFAAVPVPEKGGKEFIATATAALAPVRTWINARAAALAGEIARAFRAHRIRAQVLTFDDQVGLAAELVHTPAAIAEIRRRHYHVILDEAQDTDPQQFDILLEIARPEAAEGPWSGGRQPPEGGRFSMVGDCQQSIYRDRADLAVYQRVHDYLSQTPDGEALTYGVTFRCARAVTEFANRIFPSVLHGRDGQVAFVPLSPRAEAEAGQVLRLSVEAEGDPESSEAVKLAAWIRATGLAGLQARRWGEVAILAPRKRWFGALDRALRAAGFETQLLSNRQTLAESPAFAWAAALATVMAAPRNGFELVGVLREIFGVSDHDLAFFARSDGRRFQILEPIPGDGPVESALTRLRVLREAITALPVAAAARQLEREILAARVAILPGAGKLADDLEAAMACAAQAGVQGGGLAEWAEQLRALRQNPPEEGARKPDAIAIVTNFKAKGLEWDAIIVPDLFREIKNQAEEYPRLLGARGDPAVAVFSKHDVPAEATERESCAAARELGRVAYVTATRARRTLVLVEDGSLWGGAAGRSLAGALRLDADNSTVFAGLPDRPMADPTVASVPVEADAPETTALSLTGATAAADSFPRQVTPHRLAKAFTPDEPEVRSLNHDLQPRLDGRDYGIWWHNLMRDLPWAQGPEAWTRGFTESLAQCPDPARGRIEFDRFSHSALARRLAAAGARVLVEVPFHSSLEDGRILEGVIDLCALSPAGDRWLLLDWKASDRRPDDVARSYQAQIDAYRCVLEGITGLPVDAVLYHTPTGEVPLPAASATVR